MSDLRETLFAASPDLLAALCERHCEEIVGQFPRWTVLPEPLRRDREAAKRWVAALIRIGEQLERLDEPRPMAWLHGEGRDDPVAQWHAALAQADELSSAGRSEEAVSILRPVLASLEQSTGPVVDDLLAKARGKLAVALLALGDVAGARIFTRDALEACVATGDLYGMWVYHDNLDILDAVTADEPLTMLRAQLAEAQDLSDTGHYAAAQAILAELADRDDVDRYRGKLCGLIGLNLYRLGEVDGARAWTQSALQVCRDTEDMHGVTIYTENLRVMDVRRANRRRTRWSRWFRRGRP
ncbi:MAG: hypothetical protein EOP24_32340 [Hyphomicrobiales bacterium]|nr:MAG: hypothetical protein EOP24_32340 [Hyphomicrobiales bacterium]